MGAIVLIAASAGGLKPLRTIVAGIPSDSTASVFIVMHIGAHHSVLPDLLNGPGRLPAAFARDGESIKPGRVYVAPPDRHLLLEQGNIRWSHGPKVHYTRPAADPLFISAAEAFGSRVIGVVLSGGDGDGAEGLRVIKKHGGTSIVEDPEEAEVPSMPCAALAADAPGCMQASEIAKAVCHFCVSRHNHTHLPA